MRVLKTIGLMCLMLFVVTGLSEAKSYQKHTGLASWHDYSGDRTVKSRYRNAYITASRRYPCGTVIKVTNKANNKSVTVTVRDWGPAGWTNRALDLNKPAFRKIANIGSGEIKVSYYILKMGKCRIHSH